MREVLHNTSYLNIKEINLMLRDYVMRWGYDAIEYGSFASDLYEVRYDLARSRIMDINIKKLGNDFFTASGYEVDENGWMAVEHVRKIISDSKQLTLTPCEINMILGLSNHNEEGKIEIAHFQNLFA